MLNFMDNLRQDLRYAGRVLRQSPGFTAIAVLTLAVGIGGITTIFSVVNGVILHPLPYGDADRLVLISEVRKSPVGQRSYVPPPKGEDWEDRTVAFDGLGTFQYAPFTFTDGSDDPLVIGGRVPFNYFSVLQAKPQIGRNFTGEDGAAGAPGVAIVTYGFWKSRLGGDRNALGKTLKFAEGTVTVIGVMPPSFLAPVFRDARIFTPVSALQPPRGLIGRLKPGISGAQAESAINGLIQQIDAEFHPGESLKRFVELRPVLPVDVSNRALLLMLFGSVGFILLMAIINVANLMLSRTLTREREIAVRCAIGASRRRLIRQLLTESLLLSVFGGGSGLLLGYVGIQVLVSWIPQNFPRVQEIYMDPSVAAFVFAATLLASIGFGIFPALVFSRPNLQESLKDGSPQASEPRRNRYLRQSLVTIEIGLAAVLLIGAALIGKSFWNLIHVPLGFDTQNVVIAALNVPARYRGQAAGAVYRNDLISRLKQHTEVEAVGMSDRAPVATGYRSNGFWLEGRPQRENATVIDTQVTSDYFRSLHVSFTKGQTFKDGEQDAVINEAFANAYLPNIDPIGMQIRLGFEENPGPWLTITGVTPNERVQLNQGPMPEVFHSCGLCGILLVRSRDTSTAIGATIRRENADIDSALVIEKLEPLETMAAGNTLLLDSRFRMALFAAFAGAGLLLAFAGVYGVTSYSAAQRSHEIGIRMALGASRWEVLRMVMAQSALPVALGIAGGVIASAALSGLLQSYLFEVPARDAGTFAVVASFLALAAIGANFIPAYRSTRVDPMSALKYE